MLIETLRLTQVQERILQENFERSGPFLLNRDVHAMLDCAYAPEQEPEPREREQLSTANTIEASSASMDVPLGVPFNAKLREEFFGGILFDCDHHRHYMVDHSAYELLKPVVHSYPTGRDLLQLSAALDIPQANETLASLLRTRLLAPSSDAKPIKYFPARNLSLGYLQSPIIVEVEVTYGCFRACRHCAYESSPEGRMPNELTVEQWRTIFMKLAEAGALILQLTGGDPLFREDSFEIIEAADDAGLSVYVRSDTAALSEVNVNRLKALRGLWHVGTSIDGADSETHDWMRGHGAFEVLRDRIGIMASHDILVAAGATLHKGNFSTVRDIGRRTVDFGARWFDIGFLAPIGRGANLRHLVLDKSEIVQSLESYLQGVRDGDFVPSHSHYLRRARSVQPFADLADLIGDLPYMTEWPFSRLRLSPTGSSYTAGKLKGSEYANGFNLLNASVPHVWDNSPNLQRLRQWGAGGRIHSLDYRGLTPDRDLML